MIGTGNGDRMNRKSVLVVDDEEKIVDVIASYLEREGFTAHKAFTGMEALRSYEKFRPALVILDLMLPDMPGEKVCMELRKRGRVPVLMLTAKVEEQDLLKGFQAGADDYLAKPFSPRELVARVRAILKRTEKDMGGLCEQLEFDDGGLVIDHMSREVCFHGKTLNLTATEYRLLHTLASYPRRVFSRTELATTVLGDDYEGNERTIDTHVKNLRHKINDDSKTPVYIITVFGVGYKFQDGNG
jgi:DNA-binding response OmpR family regulator